jgi:DNA invertase Pin-like site-specific DNA recombinase
MIKVEIDFRAPHPCARYGRMSDEDLQNPRSPDQQFDMIDHTVRRLDYPWVYVRDYRDDGIKGRYWRKRPGFQQMLADIRTGAIQIDFILVDTLERLGRLEEMQTLRADLYRRHGVLVLTADSNFSDPTCVAGKIHAAFEALRATEDTRVKSHNVARGKRDVVLLKHWPGGPVPAGYRLEVVMTQRDGRPAFDYSYLVPDPRTDCIVRKAFTLGLSGLGSTRVAKALNDDATIPAAVKPVTDQSVNGWFNNPIYKGEYHYGRVSTDIVNDVLVTRRNPADQVLVVKDYCEPLVPPADWDALADLRRVRSDRARAARAARAAPKAGGSKRVAPLTPGVALKYPLTGLVRCGRCGRSMVPNAGGRYTTKAGVDRLYVYYICPQKCSGACPNGVRVPEDWLRATVLDLIRRRLFPAPTDGRPDPDRQRPDPQPVRSDGGHCPMPYDPDAVERLPWFRELSEEVRREVERRRPRLDDRRPAVEREIRDIDEQELGWLQTLGKRDLHPATRAAVEDQLGRAVARRAALRQELDGVEAAGRRAEAALDPRQVVDRLNRLGDVLGRGSAGALNVELSLHLDRIECFEDGRVVVRTCKLGALAAAADLLREDAAAAAAPRPDRRQRRRPLVRVDRPDGDIDHEAAWTASDLERFAGLGPGWFWEDEFRPPPKLSWPARHAQEVARVKAETQLSNRALAKKLGVCKYSIDRALAIARRKPDADSAPPPAA